MTWFLTEALVKFSILEGQWRVVGASECHGWIAFTMGYPVSYISSKLEHVKKM